MLRLDFDSQEKVPLSLVGFFRGVDIEEVLDKKPEGEGVGRVEILYTYPSGSLIVPDGDTLGVYRLELSSVEFDSREGVSIRSSYLVFSNQ